MSVFPGAGNLSSAWLENTYYVSPSGSSASSGRAGSPTKYIYDGLVNLIAAGGGTLECDSLSEVGGPVAGQGIRLRLDFLPSGSHFFNAPGFLPLTVPIRIVGNGNSAPAGPFTSAPTTDYIGGGNNQFNPAIWLVGSPVTGSAFSMVNMQSSWAHQAEAGIPSNLRAGKLGARMQVDYDRNLDGTVKQISVTNATRVGTSTVYTVNINATTAINVVSASRTAGVVTLNITNPGYPFAPWSKNAYIRFASTDEANFPSGDYKITAMHNWAATNTNWTVSYLQGSGSHGLTTLTGSTVKSNGCSEGELVWLTSNSDHFPDQQYYVTDADAGSVTVQDVFGDGNQSVNNVGTIARQERRCVPLVYLQFDNCSQGIDSSFFPHGATHSWDIGSNIATYPVLNNCWGEGSISGGGLPNYDWRNFSALFGYGGSGSGQNDAGCTVELNKFQCNNGGILLEASPFGAVTRLVAQNGCLVEQSSFDSVLPGILFRGNQFSSIFVDNFENADGADDAAAVEIVNTPMSAAIVQRSGKVKGQCIQADNWRAPSAWGPGSTVPSPFVGFSNSGLQTQYWADGQLAAKHNGVARAFGVTSARFKNVIADSASWTLRGATVTTGQSAPDGSSTAYKIQSAGDYVSIFPLGLDGDTWAVGDRFVMNCWVNVASESAWANGEVFRLTLVDSALWNNGLDHLSLVQPHSKVGWQFMSFEGIVGTIVDTTPRFEIEMLFTNGSTAYIWAPTAYHMPASVGGVNNTATDLAEAAALARHQPRYLLPGMAGTMEGQKLVAHGGLATAKRYTVGGGAGQITIGSAAAQAIELFDESGNSLGVVRPNAFTVN